MLTSQSTAGSTTYGWGYNLDNSTANVSTNNGAKTAYSYDAQGDLMADGCSTYTYDGFDRTAEVVTGAANAGYDCPATTASTATSTYTYDGLGRQTSDTQTVSGSTATSSKSTTSYLYNGFSTSNLLDEINVGGTSGTDNQYQPGVDGTPVALSTTTSSNSSPLVTYLDGDGLGDITDLINAATTTTSSGNTVAAGSVTCTAQFDPWGDAELASTSDCNRNPDLLPVNNDYWYESQRQDTTTGNYQLGARTYTPNNAAYTAPDSYGSDQTNQDLAVGTDPLTENTYAYVNGNPVTFNDPDGHSLAPVCSTEQECIAQATPIATEADIALGVSCVLVIPSRCATELMHAPDGDYQKYFAASVEGSAQLIASELPLIDRYYQFQAAFDLRSVASQFSSLPSQVTCDTKSEQSCGALNAALQKAKLAVGCLNYQSTYLEDEANQEQQKANDIAQFAPECIANPSSGIVNSGDTSEDFSLGALGTILASTLGPATALKALDGLGAYSESLVASAEREIPELPAGEAVVSENLESILDIGSFGALAAGIEGVTTFSLDLIAGKSLGSALEEAAYGTAGGLAGSAVGATVCNVALDGETAGVGVLGCAAGTLALSVIGSYLFPKAVNLFGGLF